MSNHMDTAEAVRIILWQKAQQEAVMYRMWRFLQQVIWDMEDLKWREKWLNDDRYDEIAHEVVYKRLRVMLEESPAFNPHFCAVQAAGMNNRNPRARTVPDDARAGAVPDAGAGAVPADHVIDLETDVPWRQRFDRRGPDTRVPQTPNASAPPQGGSDGDGRADQPTPSASSRPPRPPRPGMGPY